MTEPAAPPEPHLGPSTPGAAVRRRLGAALALAAALTALLPTEAADAQPAPAEAGTPTAPSASAAASASDAVSTDDRVAALERRLAAQEEETARLRAERDAAEADRAALAARVGELEGDVAATQADQAALTEQLVSDEDYGKERLLSAWGFFDMTFAKSWLSPEGSVLQSGLPDDSSFIMGGANIYLHSQMTRTLSALMETRVTFLPNGYVQEYPGVVVIDDSEVPLGSTYERVDTTVSGPTSLAEYRPGGILIERLHLDWTPRDWFNVRVGRFLTNYGIWNIDHGSPVIVAVLPPVMVSAQLVPSWLTGLELYGRYPLGDRIRLDASFSLSNGRGPIDEWRDLDANKAVTGLLRVTWSDRLTSVSLGAFGYHGRYTNSFESFRLHVGADGVVDASSAEALVVAEQITDSYDESMFAADLKVTWRGLLLQSEVVTRRVEYLVAPPLDGTASVAQGVPVGQTAYAPNNVGYAFYALVGYELPLDALLGSIAVMPYGSVERSRPADAGNAFDQWQIRAGVNVKPAAYVTLKAEVMRVDPENSLLGDATTLYGQVAVAF